MREKAARTRRLPPPWDTAKAASGPPRHKTHQPWKKTATNTQGFGKTSLPRKVGGS